MPIKTADIVSRPRDAVQVVSATSVAPHDMLEALDGIEAEVSEMKQSVVIHEERLAKMQADTGQEIKQGFKSVTGAQGEAAEKSEKKESKATKGKDAGLALAGPFGAAFKEMSNTFSGIKENAIVQKMFGKKEAEQLEGQVESMDAIVDALDDSEKAEDKRHRQLMKAIGGIDGGGDDGGWLDFGKDRKRKKRRGKDKRRRKSRGRRRGRGKGLIGAALGMVGLGGVAGSLLGDDSGITDMVTGEVADRGVEKLASRTGKRVAVEGAEKVGAKAATKGIGKTLGRALGPIAAIGMAGYDAYQGFNDAEMQKKAFNLKDGEEASYMQKQSAAVANILDLGGLGTGLLSMAGIQTDTADMAELIGGGIGDRLFDFFNKKDEQEKNKESVSTFQKFIMNPIQTSGEIIRKAVGMDKAESAKKSMMAIAATKSTSSIAPEGLGALSEKYESGGKGAGTISTGRGDYGGKSYGTYQLASKTGTLDRFLKWAEGQQGDAGTLGKSLVTAKESGNLDETWKASAESQPKVFEKMQHDFIQATHYDPLMQGLSKKGIDLSGRSKAVQDVLWSTGVHHGAGGGSKMVQKALKGADVGGMSDEQIIKAIYAERGKKNAEGDMAYFKSSSEGVQAGVAKRFEREQSDALAMLEAERAAPPAPATPAPAQAQAVTVAAEPTVAAPAPVAEVSTKPMPTPEKVVKPTVAEQVAAAKAGGGPGTAGAIPGGGKSDTDRLIAAMAGNKSAEPKTTGRTARDIPTEIDDATLTLIAYDRI